MHGSDAVQTANLSFTPSATSKKWSCRVLKCQTIFYVKIEILLRISEGFLAASRNSSGNYVIQTAKNTFEDIYTGQEFSFVAEKTNSLEHERRITLNFNGQTGYMVEQSSPPVGQVNSDCV